MFADSETFLIYFFRKKKNLLFIYIYLLSMTEQMKPESHKSHKNHCSRSRHSALRWLNPGWCPSGVKEDVMWSTGRRGYHDNSF